MSKVFSKIKIKIMILILLISISSIFAFNNTLNKTNSTTITNLVIDNSTLSIVEVEKINPYKEKKVKEIKFRNFKYKPQKGINDKIKLKSKDDEKQYIIIQFNKQPNKDELNKLKEEGIELLEYISSESFYASISNELENIFEEDLDKNLKIKKDKFSNKFIVRSIDEIKPEFIVSNNILNNKFKSWALNDNENKIFLNIRAFDLESLNKLKNKLLEENIEVLSEINSLNLVTINLEIKKLNLLLQLNEIKSINQIYPRKENQLENSTSIVKVNLVQDSPYDLKGDGINILQYESYVSNNHSDFGNRLEIKNAIPFTDDHATHVAGILIGNGSINSNMVGIAPKSKIIGYEDDILPYGVMNDFKENFKAGINNYSSNLGSVSWGTTISSDCSLGGDYSDFSELIDQIIFGNITSKKIPIIFASGNYYDDCSSSNSSVTPEASSKNSISVGAIDYHNLSIRFSSSRGFTDDKRIKPELVAPGARNFSFGINSTFSNNSYGVKSGTSMAAPHVSGTIALMLEQFNKSNLQTPLPSTIKALLLDSTTDLHRSGNGTQIIDGPDYVNGFGLLNAKAAVDRIIAETFLESVISTENDVDIYAINITNQTQLKITLAWDDPAGSNLINDLDLKLISPNGITYYPWSLDPDNPSNKALRNQSEHLNNIEQVYVNESEIENGEWLVIISATDCNTLDCPQKYSLVSEEQLKESRIKISQTPSILEKFNYIKNNIYEINLKDVVNLESQIDIYLGNYSHSTNLSNNERKVYLIKNTPIVNVLNYANYGALN